MQRLNNDELNTRIHKFLDRKFSEFPELADGEVRLADTWQDKHAKGRHSAARYRWADGPGRR